MRAIVKILVAAGLCASGVLLAQSGTHTGHHAINMVDGEVQMVDRKARNVTLRHAEIKNMQMPAMTMVSTSRSRRCSIKSRRVTRSSSKSKPSAVRPP